MKSHHHFGVNDTIIFLTRSPNHENLILPQPFMRTINLKQKEKKLEEMLLKILDKIIVFLIT